MERLRESGGNKKKVERAGPGGGYRPTGSQVYRQDDTANVAVGTLSQPFLAGVQTVGQRWLVAQEGRDRVDECYRRC
jgi:hypothetical protein